MLFFIPATLGTVALFLSLIGSFMCRFVSIFDNASQQDVYTGIWLKTTLYQLQSSQTGEWSLYKGCGSYPSGVPLDAKWKSAMAFSILAVVIGAFALFGVYFSACLPMTASRWRMVAFALVIASLFQGLTLLFLSSNACGSDRSFFEEEYPFLDLADGCGMSWGANMCIAATTLWFVAGVTACKIKSPSELVTDLDRELDDKGEADQAEKQADAEKGEADQSENQADAEKGEADQTEEQAAETPADNEN